MGWVRAMAERPRVHASFSEEFDEIRADGVVASHGLSVDINIQFALHDHERALYVLERAYSDVVAQIAQTEP